MASARSVAATSRDQRFESFDTPVEIEEFQECDDDHPYEEVTAVTESQELPLEPIERMELPWFKDPNIKVSIWAIIKDSIGKDISKLSVPVYFNDPTSLL
jgi:hypothetical protein